MAESSRNPALAAALLLLTAAPLSAQNVRALPLQGLDEVVVSASDAGGSAAECGITAEDLAAATRARLQKSGLRVVEATNSRQPVVLAELVALGCREKIPQGTFSLVLTVRDQALVTRTDAEVKAVVWEQSALDLIGTAQLADRVRARLDELLGKLTGDLKAVGIG
jgi:hypothetical protein